MFCLMNRYDVSTAGACSQTLCYFVVPMYTNARLQNGGDLLGVVGLLGLHVWMLG